MIRTLARVLTLRPTPLDDKAALVQLALQHDVGEMLLWALKQQGISTDGANWEPLRLATQQTRLHTLLFHHAQAEIHQVLQPIPHLWLKGIVLGRQVYPDATLRRMVDVDVLVPHDERKRALEALQKLGYRFYETDALLFDATDTLTAKLKHHYHLVGGVADAVQVELHFRLLGIDGLRLLPPEKLAWFWQEIEQDEAGYWVLTPEAHLLYLCAHAMLQHGDFKLSRHLDMHLLIENSSLDWEQVMQRAAWLGWTAAVQRALHWTQDYFDTAIPHLVFARADDPVAYLNRIQGAGTRWEKMRLVLVGLTWRERVRVVRKVLIPSRAYMRERYAIRRWVWPYYPRRWASQAWAVVMAVWERLRQ